MLCCVRCVVLCCVALCCVACVVLFCAVLYVASVVQSEQIKYTHAHTHTHTHTPAHTHTHQSPKWIPVYLRSTLLSCFAYIASAEMPLYIMAQ